MAAGLLVTRSTEESNLPVARACSLAG
ncbi:hypothetical protein AB1L30_06355 [Bremerella sp. JC817]